MAQYEHTLMLFKKGESVFDEETGSFSNTNDEWVEYSKCRDEVNAGRGIVNTEDGQTFNYSSVIQLPKGVRGIKYGDEIKVIDIDGSIRLTGTVAKFSADRFHSRIWV